MIYPVHLEHVLSAQISMKFVMLSLCHRQYIETDSLIHQKPVQQVLYHQHLFNQILLY